jgi:cytochrome c553
MVMRRWWSVVAGIGLVAGVATGDGDEPARGARLLAPYKAQLQQALREGLAKGPVQAISACRVEAPEIAKTLSRDGVRLGRTSHLLRNPSNSPPDWVVPILAAYVASQDARSARSVALPNGRSGYVEPIRVQPLCLTCHGADLAPDVAARIAELYPEDRAVGFRAGDLRGAFWIEFPAAE